MKNNNSILNTILITLALTIANYISRYISNVLEDVDFKKILNYELVLHRFYKKNSIEYEGKISSSIDRYNNELKESNIFSERFKALWYTIIENINTNETIHTIKEYNTNNNNLDTGSGMYIVNQKDKIKISEKYNIYAYTYMVKDTIQSDDKKSENKISSIIIELYSYTSSVETIRQFVEEITKKYLLKLELSRKYTKFIYTLSNIKVGRDDSVYDRWTETPFESTRNFNNLFFDKKENTLMKIDFFINNKKWYYDKGIPYSLGIGIHGPPGTGKTSFIKALANKTGRHIISISLKLAKTKKDLYSTFFEDRYNDNNEKNSIGFDKKIIVFEDIDCIGDIVLAREHKKNKNINNSSNDLLSILKTIKSVSNEHSSTSKIESESKTESNTDSDFSVKDCQISTIGKEEELTLDDILDLWDGIRETPGRIMILSSNHYDKLDPALKRPGRIDVTLELSYTSRQIISEIYEHLFEEKIDITILKQIEDRLYTPAEIINIYMTEERDKEKFISRLLLNKHV